MKNFFENADLNINSWLINWGFMTGYLIDGQIHSTIYHIIYQLVVIMILLMNVIRCGILLLNAKESQISLVLGDWSYFFGPRIMLNGIVFIGCSYQLMNIAFYKFCTQNPQMFYWLTVMDYDAKNKCFYRMNLNKSDSKMFIKQSLILINSLKCFAVVCLAFFLFASCLAVFIHLDDYYLNRLMGIMIFFVVFYHCIGFGFGFPVILYLVNINLVNEIFNHSYVCFQVCFYFNLKFRNLKIKASKLRDSKRKLKIKFRKVFLLVKEHEEICSMLHRFNNFWKVILFFIFSLYIVLIWSMAYPSIVYSNISLFQRLLMWLVLTETIATFAYISFIIFSISSEVT